MASNKQGTALAFVIHTFRCFISRFWAFMAALDPAVDSGIVYDCPKGWDHLQFRADDQQSWYFIGNMCRQYVPQLKELVKMLATSVVEEPQSIKDNHEVLQGVLEYFSWLDDYNKQDNVSELLSKWEQEISNEMKANSQIKEMIDLLELNGKSNIKHDKKRNKYWVEIRYEASFLAEMFQRKYANRKVSRGYFFSSARSSLNSEAQETLKQMIIVWQKYLLETHKFIIYLQDTIYPNQPLYQYFIPLLRFDSHRKLVKGKKVREVYDWWSNNTVDIDEKKKHQKLDNLTLTLSKEAEKKEKETSDNDGNEGTSSDGTEDSYSEEESEDNESDDQSKDIPNQDNEEKQ